MFIQNQNGNHPQKWDRIGTIVEVLNFDQYVVKVDGSGRITKRNRRFLRVMPTQPVTSEHTPPVSPATTILRSPTLPLPSIPSDTVLRNNSPTSWAPTNRAPLTGPESCAPPRYVDVDSERPDPSSFVQPSGSPEGMPNTGDRPIVRRSSRDRKPAQELDPTSGQWVVKGSSS